MKPKNRLIEYIGEIPVYTSNRVTLELHHKDFRWYAIVASDLGVPVRWLIKMMMSPCPNCGNDKILIPLHNMRSQCNNMGKSITKVYPNNGQSITNDPEIKGEA